ncbi:MAG TPA: glycosyltransferase family 4 protein [Verrucomicrobiae bacterium]|jgi:glycosyltransferase involved in cell wall biosynthesis|nr:glycosyltransferase family 4 protein [Verrucomicrobiae bacterium]
MRIALLTSDNRQHYREYARPAPRMGIAPEALLEGFASLPDVEIHVISCLQQPAPAPAKMAENIWYHALHVPKIGWLRTLYGGCIRAVRRKAREIRPDLVHGQGTERDCAISAVYSGYPNLVTIHGNMRALARLNRARPGSFAWLAARLEWLALGRTDGVLCNSSYTESMVASRARRRWRAPNAIRRIFFDKPLPGRRKKDAVFLNIGTVEPRKRQVELLTFAKKLWERGFRFEMRFVGEVVKSASCAAEFTKLAEEGEKVGYARRLGSLSAEQLLAAMDEACALIHTPLEESFGLVVAEALARNLKLFAASVGGVTEIAAGVDGAELVKANDWLGLENAMVQWMKSGCPPPVAAAAVMRERYHPQVVALRHLEIYREVLALDGQP